MDCPDCGAHNPDGAQYCNLCFRTFGAPEEPKGIEKPGAGASLDVLNVQVAAGSAAVVDAEIPAVKQAHADEKSVSEDPAVRRPVESKRDAGDDPPAAEEPPGAGLLPRAAVVHAGPSRARQLIVVGLVLIVLVFGAWLILSRVGSGSNYKSQKGTMSFKYPSGWTEVEPPEVAGLPGMSLATLQSSSEITLTKGGSATAGPANVLAVTSMPNNFAGTWNSVKTKFAYDFVASMEPGSAGSGSTGTTVSKPTFKDVKVGEDPAYSMKVEVKTPKGNAEIEQVLVIREETAYVFTFYTRKPEGSAGLSEDILKTVKFELAKPTTETHD
ncbi:MAG: hypothetical protein ACYC99_11260 [Candidatus Geothermincolia bacterium]